MHTRLFYSNVQQGKTDEAVRVLTEFAQRAKSEQKGCILVQVLQSGNEVMGVSSWETQQDLVGYADSDLARELFKRIGPLLIGMPTVRSYEVKVNLCDPAALKPA
jgi:heme-degrading monooxygenase HmoA